MWALHCSILKLGRQASSLPPSHPHTKISGASRLLSPLTGRHSLGSEAQQIIEVFINQSTPFPRLPCSRPLPCIPASPFSSALSCGRLEPSASHHSSVLSCLLQHTLSSTFQHSSLHVIYHQAMQKAATRAGTPWGMSSPACLAGLQAPRPAGSCPAQGRWLAALQCAAEGAGACAVRAVASPLGHFTLPIA